MSMNDGGPAYPGTVIAKDGMWGTAPAGMSLRDYFAAAALTGLLQKYGVNERRDSLAEEAYGVADALLAERGRKG